MSDSTSHSRAKMLAEAAIMVAIATVLSLIKLLNLPYGGSVTVACMLPIIIISYRHGLRWGMLTGFVFGLIQQLLELNTLSYVTTWQSVIAVILLDYFLAFMVIGLGGIFRDRMSQPKALVAGTIFVCVIRYLCHVISGATVWAGLSIPTNAALLYSIGYNATYMIPETIVTAVLAFTVGSILDFSGDRVRHFVPKSKRDKRSFPIFEALGALFLAAVLFFDVRSVFLNLQNAETGEFDATGFANVNWIAVAIFSVIGIALSVTFYMLGSKKRENEREGE